MTSETFPAYTDSKAAALWPRLIGLTAVWAAWLNRCQMRLMIIAAFTAVYVVWGSTYLAIRFAIETMPPFLMAALRFLAAGAILYVWALKRGAPRPTAVHWRTGFIVGGLLLVGGNGSVVWAAQFVPSGLTALLIATVPLWIVVITSVAEWQRPSLLVTGGVALGLAGIALLVGPEKLATGENSSLMGMVVIVTASFIWALGTYVSRRAPQSPAPMMSAALNMLAGGLLLALIGGVTGEMGQLDVTAVSLKSWLAILYLISFGSLIGFSAYLWLVKTTTPAKASSNFYVNPVVAVLLGWLLAGEMMTMQIIVAAGVIVVAVILIVSAQGRR